MFCGKVVLEFPEESDLFSRLDRDPYHLTRGHRSSHSAPPIDQFQEQLASCRVSNIVLW